MAWLKKYTDFKFLEDILCNCRLFMNHPHTWDDKNDGFAVDLAYGSGTKRVLCLNSSPDRIHFWNTYAKGRDGVCLWFDKDTLLADLKEGCEHGRVFYPPFSDKNSNDRRLNLGGKTKPKNAAFVKRVQYADEQEYRIVRDASQDKYLKFPPKALRKIFLSAQLDDCCVETRTNDIGRLLSDAGFSGVDVLQNRALNNAEWQEALVRTFQAE